MTNPKRKRSGLLAKIHILKKDLGMIDDHYRDMLDDLTGKRSAGDLTIRQLARVADHMTILLQGPQKKRPCRTTQTPQLLKIHALLTAGRRPLSYGDVLARQICRVDRLEWVPEADLYKIITALRKQADREGWPSE